MFSLRREPRKWEKCMLLLLLLLFGVIPDFVFFKGDNLSGTHSQIERLYQILSIRIK